MTEQDKQRLESLKEEWAILHKQLSECSATMNALAARIDDLDERRQRYYVRIYREVYYDVTSDGFDEEDAVKNALEEAYRYELERYDHFAASKPRAKYLCCEGDLTKEMRETDE